MGQKQYFDNQVTTVLKRNPSHGIKSHMPEGAHALGVMGGKFCVAVG
jgi:hypothetical protein